MSLTFDYVSTYTEYRIKKYIVLRFFSADEELALGITDDPVVSASRPVTRVPSNMTSARSSRFVDWGGG